MISFNDWLHHNDGDRLEGLREEYADVRRDSGDDCPEFMDWAEHKYHVQRLRSWNDEHPISLPPLAPSGLKITLPDQVRDPLHSFRLALAEVERALERSKTSSDHGIQNALLQAEISADLEDAVRRREHAAVVLAMHVEALVAAAEAQQASTDFDVDGERYTAGLKYVASGNLDPDGHEVETNAPYYFGHSAIKAFEAGAQWQAKRSIEPA